jgi:hypothetical protein
MISKVQGRAGAEAPVDKSPAANTNQSIKLEAAGQIAREVVMIPEFEAGINLASKGQVRMEPEAPAGEALATGTTPSIDLEAAYRTTEEVGRTSMTEFEIQDLSFKTIALYQKNHPDGPSFAGGGLLSAPFFLKDVIIGNGYKWLMQETPERQKDTQERIELMSDLMWDLAFDSL